ncbi:Adenylate kinase isoenzyme 6 [Halotydeus destructor]|nr:Adenylate kinase isoenzyme 6 [Halotydeus destructor]
MPRLPNILIAGTPGTGKSTLVSKLLNNVKLPAEYEHVDVNEFAKANGCLGEHDAVLDCDILDEDKLIVALELTLEDGGKILDYHGADLFPEDLIDHVFVTRTDNSILYDRYTDRGYSELKVSNNIQSEIFQVILDEALEGFGEDGVTELQNNNLADLEANCDKVIKWIKDWIEENEDN